MLSELGTKCNFLPSIPNDQKSPYLLQYKVFQDRLKRQQKGKSLCHVRKNKTAKTHKHEDYMQLTRNILTKKQNLNLLEDIPSQTQQSINHVHLSEELACKTRMLFENKINSRKGRVSRDEVFSEWKENSNWDRSRIKSECNSHGLKLDKGHNQEVSFIGYKRNKKPIIEMGFKRVLGFI